MEARVCRTFASMEKKTQSEICNWSLLVLAILMLASGIQMEASFGADFLGFSFPVYMVFHVIVAILMTAAVIWHIWLHFSWKEWVKRFSALKRLANKEFSSERLERMRDIFLFCCYTGLAYIDVKTLTTENLVQKADGKWWIVTKRTKTEVPVNVPLLEVPMRLIKKYEPLRKGNLVFPVYSNQKSNDYLKEIAALCDIHKDVTFHVARHTFATTVTLENGVPIESVSKMLGHTNVQTTQIYAPHHRAQDQSGHGPALQEAGSEGRCLQDAGVRVSGSQVKETPQGAAGIRPCERCPIDELDFKPLSGKYLANQKIVHIFAQTRKDLRNMKS